MRLPARRTTGTLSLATILLLAGCSAEVEPAAQPPAPSEAAAPLTNDPNGFEGEFAVDWTRVAWPLDDATPLNTIEAAAGRLWVLANTNPQESGTFSKRTGRDRLFFSDDGVEWNEIDLDALGIPADINGGAVISGDDERVAVVFSNANAIFGPEVEQFVPWVLVGDIDDWQVFSPEELGPWSVVNAGTARPRVGSMVDVALVGDTVIAAAESLWFGTAKSVTSVIATLSLDLRTGNATLLTDRAAPFGDDDLHLVERLVTFEGAVYGFGQTTAGGGASLAVWRTTDGVTWTEQLPAFGELPPFVSVIDAVASPAGLVVVAEVDADGIGFDGSVALFSPDGVEWTVTDLGGAWAVNHVFWAEDTFVATGFAGPDHPIEGFEVTWLSTDGVDWESVDRTQLLFFAFEVVSIPGALIAVENDQFMVSGALPPYSVLDGADAD